MGIPGCIGNSIGAFGCSIGLRCLEENSEGMTACHMLIYGFSMESMMGSSEVLRVVFGEPIGSASKGIRRAILVALLAVVAATLTKNTAVVVIALSPSDLMHQRGVW
jgi:hypothetical protein